MFFMIGLPSAFALPAAAPADGLDCPIEMVRREMSNDKGQKKTLLVRDSFVPTARSKRGDVERRDVNFPSPGPVAFNGDQCGTSTFENTDDDSATGCNIDDCNALASGLRGLDQHWELTNGFGGAVKDWLLLAPAGTCQFYIDRSDFFDATTDGKNFVGTSDVADLVADSTANFQKWGTVTYPGGSFQVGSVPPVKGNRGCFPTTWNTPWRIQSNQP
ncbi:hypothetical protein EDB81DRAFT_755561 [Dactylonectria macrodidyma]|uniref:Ecp2 effector protein-like domain-containing protein n=1 Tax=Dactylonectria macrodidyma TaxID=307937 RepID=A0A9P9FHB4_9HYPO|nr:hypothetical protein EDB81DRAFT_755561 [Dactylonectria macrodidyma]